MIIGLSQRILQHRGRAYDSIEHGWYSFLAGHTLFYLPNTVQQDFDQVADALDIFIITGGDDHPLRRLIETKLATAMIVRQKPIIGICHGAFMLTTLCEGTVEDCDAHNDCNHPIFYFGDIKEVNSYHNMAITAPPPKAVVLCTDELGQCEAWIDGNIAAVVWHPERMENPWLPDEIAKFIN